MDRLVLVVGLLWTLSAGAQLTTLQDGQICTPETLYIFRHAERFFAFDGNGADDSQEILTPEGFVRARALRDKFIDENIPVDTIFVSAEFVRSYQTASYLESIIDVPVRRYEATSPNSEDILTQVQAADPCPTNAMIISHGDFIVDVFAQFGADASNVPNITDFGFVFTLTFPEGVPNIDTDTYGVPESNGDVNFPPIVRDPFQRECSPSTFYILRHSERFIAAPGNGLDDGHEVLTLEGFQRAQDLEQKFIDEHLPLEAVFVDNEFIRTHMTSQFVNGLFQVPVTRYNALGGDATGVTPDDFDGQDLAARITALNPCPDHVMVVTHGNAIVDVFNNLGFDANDVPQIGDFGKFYTLTFDANGIGHVDVDSYGVPETKDNQPFPVVKTTALPPTNPDAICQPETFYIFRHAERFFAAAGNGADDSQEILSPEGFVRAEALKDKFEEENLPLDAIFVSAEFVRSYQTAHPLESVRDAPVRRYMATSPNSQDIADQVAAMDPCPQHAMIVTHGDFIVEVFASLGADASQIPDITEFGFVFTLTFDDDGSPRIIETTYGVPQSNGDVDFPPVEIDPNLDVCEPSTFYILRHTERFIAAPGNGLDDSQEALTFEGFQRSIDLRQKFIDDFLPLEAIFVDNEFIRTHQTAAFTEELFQVPLTRYNALGGDATGVTPDDFDGQDLEDRISALNPCPDHVMVVTHGNAIIDVFNHLGFNADDVPQIGDFGKFFTLTFDDNRVGSVNVEPFGSLETLDNQPFPVVSVSALEDGPLPTTAGTCEPSKFYIFRHAERFFAADGNGADDSQEILSPEGFVRARALRDQVVDEGIEVDALFVSAEFIRSYQTVAPLDAEIGVPVRRYAATSPNSQDIRDQVAAMDPCPENAMIITHGDLILSVFAAFGVDASEVPDITTFGKIFTLTFPDGEPSLIETTYGVPQSEGDVNFPPVDVDPNLDVCEPSTFYILRHAERFTAAAGNGLDDSQEILTPEGFQRARDLEQKFIDELLPLEAIFVDNEFIRTYQTASPTEELFEVPVTRYDALSDDATGVAPDDFDGQDLEDRVSALNPCPDHVMVVTHGNAIVDVFNHLGFDATQVPNIGDFGKFFTLTFDENRVGTVVVSSYGVDETNGNIPFDEAASASTQAIEISLILVVGIIIILAIAIFAKLGKTINAKRPILELGETYNQLDEQRIVQLQPM